MASRCGQMSMAFVVALCALVLAGIGEASALHPLLDGSSYPTGEDTSNPASQLWAMEGSASRQWITPVDQVLGVPRPTRPLATGQTLWSADHETGDLSQWYFPSTGPSGDYGGGEYNSGSADSVASTDFAHSGTWGVKMEITTPSDPTSGTRLFRWQEPRAYDELQYSVWYYFPVQYHAPNWWNVLQWKSRNSAKNDPFFILNVGDRTDGSMYFYLYDWQQRTSYQQSALSLPLEQWFHVEAQLLCAGDRTGRIIVWQDAVKIFDVANVQTRYADGDCEWSVNNYSDSVTPNPTTIYIDDASIRTVQAAAEPIFVDVPIEHPYHDDIESLYQAGYTAGCNTDPLMYCPEQTMNRAESAVFVERGIHGVDGLPPQPTTQTFADLPLDSWAAKWAEALWQDHYTAGCGSDPLVYCPWQGHTRAEGCVFYLHMLHGPDYAPPQPTQQTFADVPLDAWFAKWIQAGYDAGLLEPCQTTPDLRFCPNDPLSRALAAYMMVQAKGLR